MPFEDNIKTVDTDSDEASTEQVRYVVITPVRNEEENIDETIRSVSDQSVRPLEWVIVDDGSTDKTAEILDRYAFQLPWIRVFHLADRGFREPGTGVIRAFNYGLHHLNEQEWEFIVKLDGDLKMERDYFERCFAEFRRDPKLAIGGGTICHRQNGILRPDSGPRFHVRGATKIYRRGFWDMSGGLLATPGWDTLDEVKANMLGWRTRSFSDTNLVHRRPTGSADGVWRNWFKNGRANYITGYHPVFVILKCVKRIPQKPFFLSSFALFCGFVSGYFMRVPQVNDKDLVRYVRRQQVLRMLLQESIWK